MHGVSATEAVNVRWLNVTREPPKIRRLKDTRSVDSDTMTRRVYAEVRQFHRNAATLYNSAPSGASESASTATKKNAPEIQNVSMSIYKIQI